MTGRQIYTSNGIEWAMPIEIDCKINCMKNLIQQMFMNFLAESVCDICNVRCYRHDLHIVPFNKIPSTELFKILNDFDSVIPQLQKIEGSLSNNKINCNNDAGVALAGDDKEKG